eukprot:TRINITY_DN12934_c0_g1_i1.p1 TRINITY_DN12934_c0_g1~~TRINITY_DN12934_c0_g1_i1.p1  ORF type:complete len:508 (-),score=83.35 TRINITY_DN12934_c0_g1_i1:40-1455(-)
MASSDWAGNSQRLKDKFEELDIFGRGSLGFRELLKLLRQGDPRITERQALFLFNKCDKNHDGTIQFSEFCDFVYDQHLGRADSGPATRRSPASRLSPRQVASRSPSKAGDAHVQPNGEAVRHSPRTSPKRSPRDHGGRLLRSKEHEDHGHRHEPLRSPNRDSDVPGLPPMQRVRSSPPAGMQEQRAAPASCGRRRSTPVKLTRPPLAGYEGDEEYWEQIKPRFHALCAMEDEMDGREFAKNCQDWGFYDRRFAVNDVDVIFAGCVVPGSRRMGWLEFQEAIRCIARKKGCSTIELQGQIMEAAEGPQFHDVTVPQEPRFVQHAPAHAEARSNDDRHARLARQTEDAIMNKDSEDDDSWRLVEARFDEFLDVNGLGVVDFVKLLIDCDIIDRRFTRRDAELVFTNVRVAGRQKFIWFDQFKEAMRLVAARKGCPVSDLQAFVACSTGPQYEGTEVEKVRLHDNGLRPRRPAV